ncbi:hypothetical protein O1M54_13130 [Streptomyces diastatochromogenes]|nr:hypothetical protein [Streptomyces diastatochromogenes]
MRGQLPRTPHSHRRVERLRRPAATRLWLVTEGAQWLPGDPAGDGGHLGAATLWGFGRVLLTEYPQYRTTLVDLAPGSGLAPLADEWRSEPPGEYQVAHRPGRRYVRRLLAGDSTLTWTGGFELRAPDSGDLSDLAPAAATGRAPEAEEVQVRVHTVGLTAEDARTALDTGRAERAEEDATEEEPPHCSASWPAARSSPRPPAPASHPATRSWSATTARSAPRSPSPRWPSSTPPAPTTPRPASGSTRPARPCAPPCPTRRDGPG